MPRPLLLSDQGSDRGTGYDLSNKLVRRGRVLVVGWLDAPAAPGQPARVMLGAIDPDRRARIGQLCLAEGVDNHCGPALALEPSGRLHFMSGAHHGAFLHRWTDAADVLDPEAWSDPEPVGTRASYPSLLCDARGALHLAYRSSQGARWQLAYRRKPPGAPWTAPRALAESPMPGYSHFMQSLRVNADGTLHLVFQFHYGATGKASDCLTYAAAHITSRDGGRTWQAADGSAVDAPVSMANVQPFCRAPQGGLRINSMALDGQGCPWTYAVHPDYPGGRLYRLAPQGSDAMAPGPALDAFDLRGGRSMAMAFDRAEGLHLLFAQHPAGAATDWFDPAQELHYARWPAGVPQAARPVSCLTGPDASAAHWLPVLEWIDPSASQATPRDVLWYVWTQGLNRGGIGGDNANALKTRIWLSCLDLRSEGDG